MKKTETELQIASMLKSCLIAHSNNSPFASPVLLVKKKDGSWRFYIDYRHIMQAITAKNKHPILVVDELLDELSSDTSFI